MAAPIDNTLTGGTDNPLLMTGGGADTLALIASLLKASQGGETAAATAFGAKAEQARNEANAAAATLQQTIKTPPAQPTFTGSQAVGLAGQDIASRMADALQGVKGGGSTIQAEIDKQQADINQRRLELLSSQEETAKRLADRADQMGDLEGSMKWTNAAHKSAEMQAQLLDFMKTKFTQGQENARTGMVTGAQRYNSTLDFMAAMAQQGLISQDVLDKFKLTMGNVKLKQDLTTEQYTTAVGKAYDNYQQNQKLAGGIMGGADKAKRQLQDEILPLKAANTTPTYWITHLQNLRDPNGNPLFDPKNADDRTRINTQGAELFGPAEYQAALQQLAGGPAEKPAKAGGGWNFFGVGAAAPRPATAEDFTTKLQSLNEQVDALQAAKGPWYGQKAINLRKTVAERAKLIQDMKRLGIKAETPAPATNVGIPKPIIGS